MTFTFEIMDGHAKPAFGIVVTFFFFLNILFCIAAELVNNVVIVS